MRLCVCELGAPAFKRKQTLQVERGREEALASFMLTPPLLVLALAVLAAGAVQYQIGGLFSTYRYASTSAPLPSLNPYAVQNREGWFTLCVTRLHSSHIAAFYYAISRLSQCSLNVSSGSFCSAWPANVTLHGLWAEGSQDTIVPVFTQLQTWLISEANFIALIQDSTSAIAETVRDIITAASVCVNYRQTLLLFP